MSLNILGALLALIIGLILGFVIAWFYWLQRVGERESPQPQKAMRERVTLQEAPAPPTAEPPEPDDLKRIEGIGPKISSVLQSAGVTTFEQLAASDADELRQILREEGLQFVDPATWPEQAELAAAGAWDALEDLQDELTAGRRV